MKLGEILFIFKKEADYWHAELISIKKIGQIPASVAEYVLEIIEDQLNVSQYEETITDFVSGNSTQEKEKKPTGLNLNLESVRVTRDKRADALISSHSAREKGNNPSDKEKIAFDLTDKSLRYQVYICVVIVIPLVLSLLLIILT